MTSKETQISREHRRLIIDLHRIGAIKFGDFKLKSGIQSPLYVDLRLTVSHPDVLVQVATALLQASKHIPHDILCGVPYTALPFATAMSIKSNKPMVMRRKEAKAHGTKQIIEGSWKPGDSCLIVEDLVSSGMSVLETVEPLEKAGMIVSDVVVLLNRQQGADVNLRKNNLGLHAVFDLKSMLNVLVEEQKLSPALRDSVFRFVAENQVGTTMAADIKPKRTPLTYAQRAERLQNPVGRRLLNLIHTKQTNLAVAADVTTTEQLLDLAEAVGPHICILKTHADIISDWDHTTGGKLADVAQRHQFLLFEDRKFADIGNTVLHQSSGGVHNISQWADIINAHPVPGPGIISGLAKTAGQSATNDSRQMGLLLLAEMSSKGNIPSALPGYKQKTIEMAVAEKQFVFGFISMGKIAGDDFVYMTPGVKMASGADSLGQQYATPQRVICEAESDVIIVGRGVYQAPNVQAAAEQYRQAGWEAYERRCSGSV